MPNKLIKGQFPGLYGDTTDVMIDVENDLELVDQENCIYIGGESIIAFYLWLQQSLVSKGLIPSND